MPNKTRIICFSVFLGIALGNGFSQAQKKPTSSTNTAGGDLTGTYPNPEIAPNTVGAPELIDIPGLVPGAYTSPTVTIDADGRVTQIENGSAPAGNSALQYDADGHAYFAPKDGARAPSVSCTSQLGGVFPSFVSGNDNAGVLTVGGTVQSNLYSSCELSFGTGYQDTPACFISGGGPDVTITATTREHFTVAQVGSALSMGTRLTYFCLALDPNVP